MIQIADKTNFKKSVSFEAAAYDFRPTEEEYFINESEKSYGPKHSNTHDNNIKYALNTYSFSGSSDESINNSARRKLARQKRNKEKIKIKSNFSSQKKNLAFDIAYLYEDQSSIPTLLKNGDESPSNRILTKEPKSKPYKNDREKSEFQDGIFLKGAFLSRAK